MSKRAADSIVVLQQTKLLNQEFWVRQRLRLPCNLLNLSQLVAQQCIITDTKPFSHLTRFFADAFEVLHAIYQRHEK